MLNAINLNKLNKIYPATTTIPGKIALDDINLNITRGSIFGLLGPNGAGKSTLINILANTVIKTSGLVEIYGIDIDHAPKRARQNIGIVPQEVVIDSFFPLNQALELCAGYYGIRPHLRKTDEILKALNLYDKRDNLPRQLSGGMKRRFMVAKAMVHSPKILILDEPTAGVDIELRQQLWEYVKQLNASGTTIILTTHYLAEAQELCDQIAFINHGRIVKNDTKINLLNTLGVKLINIEFFNEVPESTFESFGIPYSILSKNQVQFNLNSTNDNISKLLSQIHSVNLEIKDLKITQPDLESIFKQIIK